MVYYIQLEKIYIYILFYNFLDAAEIQNFISSMENKNTRKKTTSDLKHVMAFKEKIGEERNLEDLPARELDYFLSRFFFLCQKA